MTGARDLKRLVRELLREHDLEKALPSLREHPPRQIVNALIALFYEADSRTRWRAIAALGEIVGRLAESDRESARVVMRRLMWMLNDESGGIGWGAPEAMGEILAGSDVMASEYSRILCSYIRPNQNFLEHPGLQRGLLWGIGRLAQKKPDSVEHILPELEPFFVSSDPFHRGYAAWAAGNIGDSRMLPHLTRLVTDNHKIDMFDEGRFLTISVGELAVQAIAKINPADGKS